MKNTFTVNNRVNIIRCVLKNQLDKFSLVRHCMELLKTKMNTNTLFITGDSELVFTLKVSKASDITNFVEKSLTIRTTYSDLRPVIMDKPSEFTIGRQSGDVVLDASRSIDPDKVAVPIMYKWRCLQVRHAHLKNNECNLG